MNRKGCETSLLARNERSAFSMWHARFPPLQSCPQFSFFIPKDHRCITCQKIFNESCESGDTLRTHSPPGTVHGALHLQEAAFGRTITQASHAGGPQKTTMVPRQVDMESSRGQADLRLAHTLSSSKQGDDVDPPLTPLPAIITERHWLTKDTARIAADPTERIYD